MLLIQSLAAVNTLLWSLVAGAASMLDYTVDVALFATASAGYIFFSPVAREFAIKIGPFQHVNFIWLVEA